MLNEFSAVVLTSADRSRVVESLLRCKGGVLSRVARETAPIARANLRAAYKHQFGVTMVLVSPKKTSGREIRFSMLYDENEQKMLEDLARVEDRSAAAWVRMIIRREHASKFGARPKSKRR